jgi:uncharacterized protein YndB with AHSA1/START domain
MTNEIYAAVRLDGDRRAVRLERTYATDTKDLWSALTEPDRLARWFARVEGDLSLNGAFVIYFDADDPDGRTLGQVLKCDPPSQLEVSWFFQEEGQTRLSVQLADTGDATRLVLDHARLPVISAGGYSAGWHTYLEQLAAELSDGTASGEQWAARWEELLPAYQAKLDELVTPH